jgi:dihydroxy-acid dehydratase
LHDGDAINIDAVANSITVDLSAEELAERLSEWTMPPYEAVRGTLYKYIKNVKTASEGCVTDE